MADGDFHAPRFQHPVKGIKCGGLLPGSGQIGAVSGGKVAEKPLGRKTGQFHDFPAQIRIFCCGQEADAPHTGVHGKVEAGGLAQLLRCFGQKNGILIGENGGTDVLPDGITIGRDRGMSQHQNGLGKSGAPQLQGLQYGGNTEKGAQRLQMPGNVNGAVTVGICLDHRHHRYSGLVHYRLEVPGNLIQIYFYISMVEIH